MTAHNEDPEQNTGLVHKFDVQRVVDPEGKHAECRYFVLDPQHDPLARVALAAYAREALTAGYTLLGLDLAGWLDEIKEG